jgi:hypothetical protein
VTETQLVEAVEQLPEIIELGGMDASRKRTAIRAFIPHTIDQLQNTYEWSFLLKEGTATTIAGQANYTLSGDSSDCRHIVNIKYGDDETLLTKMQPTDYDVWVQGRTIDSVSIWLPAGSDSNGFPVVTLVIAPPSSGNTLKYRYRGKNLSVASFPDDFGYVLIYGVAKWLVSGFYQQYVRHLKEMLARYESRGTEDRRAHLDPHIVTQNRVRAGRMGWG